METNKPTALAIGGKVINIKEIGEKTLAQFKDQLKQNGIVLEDAHAEKLWLNLRGELTEEQKASKAASEAKSKQIKAEAEARADAARKAAEAKFNQLKKGE